MIIDIDDSAGFCWGVVQTIDKVEQTLVDSKDKKVHVLGQIIHNPKEGERLEARGLKTISHEEFEAIDPSNSVVIIRAHGEPPTTYDRAKEMGLELIDATCPLVKALQKSVTKYYNDGWQIIIFGKFEHAEVIGLRGVCNDECIVIKNFDNALENMDFSKNTVIFSQTTMDRVTFNEISEALKIRFNEINGLDSNIEFVTKNSICKFVSRREEMLQEFAKAHDCVVFVAGKNSSNGKILYDICRKVNLNSIFIEDLDELNFEDLRNYKSIGITGATSTPQWFMEHIKKELDNYFN